MSATAWRRYTPFYFYTAVAACLGAAAASGEGPSGGGVTLLLVAGLLSWGAVEYGLHRFVFHHDARSERGRRFVHAAHLSHHENPQATDRLFSGLGTSAPIAAGYWLLGWAAAGSWRAASYLFIGLVAGYFCYEWLHFEAHHGRPRPPSDGPAYGGTPAGPRIHPRPKRVPSPARPAAIRRAA